MLTTMSHLATPVNWVYYPRMYKIENLLNSPYDLIDADGQKVRIGPRETIETTLHPLHEGLYRAVKYFRIEGAVAKDPLDHDGDGKKGGAVSAELAEWRKVYEDEKGERPDGRWSAERIQRELGL